MLKHIRKIIPFGKVIDGGRQVFPQNEVYIGREKKREQLMRWLTSLKPSGSILVTGARGVGKSTFVKHAIGSMNVNLYERLKLKGYSVNWGDNLMIIGIFIVISTLLTFCYELLNFKTSHFFINHLIWFIGLLPFLLMIYWGGLLKRAIIRINGMTHYSVQGDSTYTNDLSILYLHLCSLSTFLTLFGSAMVIYFIHQYLTLINQILVSNIQYYLITVTLALISLALLLKNRKTINKKCIGRKEKEDRFSFGINQPILLSSVVISILLSVISYAHDDYSIHHFLSALVFDSRFVWLLLIFAMVYSFTKEQSLIKNIVKSSNPINRSNEQFNRRANYLSQWTLSSIVLRHYSPTILVNINLGFSDLHHSNIIFSMLIDLRNKYIEIFQSNHYGFLFIRHAIALLIAIIIWMSVNPSELPAILTVLDDYSTKTFIGSDAVLSQTLVGIEANKTTALSMLDLIAVIGLVALLNWLFVVCKLSRSTENLRQIDDLIDELATKRIKSKQGGLALRFKGAALDKKVIAMNEQEPLNSRLVETKLIWLLNVLKQGDKGWFLSPGKIISKPSPNILFVFDELDKLHDHSDNHNKLHPNDKRRNFTENEAARAKQIYRLLSDMKNLITNAPAKFVFIAGRDMRDQWLADANAREHFLSSIFEQEIFIPSILTDHQQPSKARLSDNVLNLLKVYQFRANKKFELKLLRHQKRNSLFSEKNEELLAEEYLLFNNTPLDKNYILEVDSLADGEIPPNIISHTVQENNRFINDYVSFLTYKSRGIPKQLKRLILENIEALSGFNDFDDALVFTEHDVCRIQFVAEVFYLIEIELGDYLINADDKMATSIFYLADFVLKFNAHAFSWRHLFRLDELAHIHKLPELHSVFEKLVNHFTGFYLNKVLNGLYTFRFRSDISKEIAYLSKVSDADSASYNFTLDESGDLKDIYRRKLDDSTALNSDYHVGLAELYDLDREFEDARENYIAAIRVLDKNHTSKSTNEAQKLDHTTMINQPYEDSHLNNNIRWGIERLGLMLQIGLTYERDNKLIYAFSNYKDAGLFSRMLFKNYLGIIANDNTRQNIDFSINSKNSLSRKGKSGQRLDVIKHVNILFQPFFAEIWILEKLHNGVDSSIDVLEQGLQKYRIAFSQRINSSGSGEGFSSQSETNFYILRSQLHNKAGDLYFFKGKKGLPEERHCNDYLNRAMHHYRVSLHEIKQYEQTRALASQQELPKYSLRFPDHTSLALAFNLLDLGETLVASTDICEVLTASDDGNKIKSVDFEPYSAAVNHWVYAHDYVDLKLNIRLNGQIETICLTSQLFGQTNPAESNGLHPPDQIDSPTYQLLAGLLTAHSGIRMLADAGYNEYASKEFHELLHLTLITLYIKGIEGSCSDRLSVVLTGLASQLLESCIVSTLKSKCGFKSPTSLNSGINKPRLRAEIQSTALSLLYMINHAKQHNASECLASINEKTTELYAAYFEADKTPLNKDQLISVMEQTLQTNQYPMVNQLRTKNWLIYMHFLKASEPNSAQAFDYFADIMSKFRIYDAPFIFTYAEVAVSAELFSASQSQMSDQDWIWLQKIKEKMTNNSVSMVTMGKKYYEEIRNLYYLFDDFNDRRNHMGHTIQMLLLSYLLRSTTRSASPATDEVLLKPPATTQ
jgi:hypothetical protein